MHGGINHPEPFLQTKQVLKLQQRIGGNIGITRAGLAVCGARMYGYAPACGKLARYLDKLRRHQFNQIIHDNIHALLVESPVISETEQIYLQALALHQIAVGDIANNYTGKIGLFPQSPVAR